ncbi:sensor histidine kinase [uncultured Aquimarina sp.]|uniref:ATP-binding protein n=1 Tax=uncultured Aquimarina sp. TaxID=575652 RepID=UPI002628159F|nr:sensor histidine kinase [uncultured Aquimarina sp.]
MEYLNFLTLGKFDRNTKLKFDKDQKTTVSLILQKLNLGNYYLTNFFGQDSIAFRYYKESLRDATSLKDTALICEAQRRILYYSQKYSRDTIQMKAVLKDYKNHVTSKNEELLYYYNQLIVKIGLKTKGNKNIVLEHRDFTKGILFSKELNNEIHEANFVFLKALNLAVFEGQFEEALKHYKEALSIFSKYDYFSLKNRKFDSYLSIGACYYMLGNYDKAIENLSIAQQTGVSNNKKRDLISLYSWFSKAYKGKSDYKNSLKYLKEEIQVKDSINQHFQNVAKADLETKYQTLEKEKKIVQLLNTNLKTEAQRIKNRNWLIGSSSALVIGLIIGILVYKNTKRKQRIAEQEREIEIQKTEKLLKDQELTAIDAMISGQEKERQRLANDLHDNLGSTLATVKLHFDHLKNNRDNPKMENVEELYNKTNNLLDEAYQKVRTIAHEKNSGVMAKQGLLPAVKNLAKKASNGDGLLIEVQDYGLDERLDNALEISIFRIIQELITNTIKHADASEIHISLTNHDSLLNIIVEDNGKGFDAKILPEKDGMGLKSIEKRIEHMEGTFEIDSTIGKGTNIIINIPI